MKKILILLTIFKATMPNACTDMCQNENNAFLRDRCYAQAYSAGAISANDLASYLGRDIIEIDLNYNPSSIVSSLTGSNAASSNAYNFFLDPGYNMFMGNYSMGPTNGTYTNSRKVVCSPQSTWYCANSWNPYYFSTIGSNPTINFGSHTDSNQRCDTSSVFHPLLVGWAERNVIPNPLSFQTSSNQLFQAPLSLPPNTGDSAQDPYFNYLVGDPNCPAAVNCSSNGNTFTHFKGCRICDQFLVNGAPSINYRYCQYGFNWKYPLSLQLQSSSWWANQNLLYYLFFVTFLWIGGYSQTVQGTQNNASWWWLSYVSSPNFEYAPTPIANTNLQEQWGKTGINNGSAVNAIYEMAPTNSCQLSTATGTPLKVPAFPNGIPNWAQLGYSGIDATLFWLTPNLAAQFGSNNWNQFSIIQSNASSGNPYSTLT